VEFVIFCQKILLSKKESTLDVHREGEHLCTAPFLHEIFTEKFCPTSVSLSDKPPVGNSINSGTKNEQALHNTVDYSLLFQPQWCCTFPLCKLVTCFRVVPLNP